MEPDPRTSSGPAVIRAAQIGRTHDRTRPVPDTRNALTRGGRPHMPLTFHPAAIRASADLLCSPSLDRPKVEFSGLLLCSPSLDRPKVEFSGLCHDDGLGAPSGFCNE